MCQNQSALIFFWKKKASRNEEENDYSCELWLQVKSMKILIFTKYSEISKLHVFIEIIESNYFTFANRTSFITGKQSP